MEYVVEAISRHNSYLIVPNWRAVSYDLGGTPLSAALGHSSHIIQLVSVIQVSCALVVRHSNGRAGLCIARADNVVGWQENGYHGAG